MDIRSSLRLINDARQIGENWYSWSVWLDGPPDEVKDIESVRYTLHPTFPNPVQTVTDRASKFKLTATGWGEFAIKAAVKMQSGRTIPLAHWIRLTPEPGSAPTRSGKPPQRRPRIFLSASAIDRGFADRLRAQLQDQGIEVFASYDIAADTPWVDAIEQALGKSDLTAIVVSGELRGFAEAELERALALDKPVVPVVLGEGTTSPKVMGLSWIRVDSEDQVTPVADALAARVKDLVYED